ncbi:hypothetical protein OBBRIDRAFT_12927 [Obba rivulosa]|uniref:Uncharacterized protein n=1 Tax=Obba rivulosa TaxID=1052685 RepID=A0A8E2J7H1_9APHY|nr:hypothetical protein OBBRIDRAFT_12927 [Obba rivulosa]
MILDELPSYHAAGDSLFAVACLLLQDLKALAQENGWTLEGAPQSDEELAFQLLAEEARALRKTTRDAASARSLGCGLGIDGEPSCSPQHEPVITADQKLTVTFAEDLDIPPPYEDGGSLDGRCDALNDAAGCSMVIQEVTLCARNGDASPVHTSTRACICGDGGREQRTLLAGPSPPEAGDNQLRMAPRSTGRLRENMRSLR